ncbi:MAG: YwiC-like family protein [Opitutales bacterium]
MPKEHGSWSLALEPVALGLLVAPSPAGAALGLAAIAGFFSRRPLKAVLARQARPRSLAAALAFMACGGIGLAATLLLGGLPALWPLVLAAPFGILFAWFDSQGDSRETAAELAGSTAFALLPATFATLAGWAAPAALALAGVALARSVPTIVAVRTFLRGRKQQPVKAWLPLLTALLGLGALLALAAARQVPWLATAGAGVLFARTVWLGSSQAPKWTATRLGLTEAILGFGYVALAAVAYWVA